MLTRSCLLCHKGRLVFFQRTFDSLTYGEEHPDYKQKVSDVSEFIAVHHHHYHHKHF